jgi:hypothetical protein
MESLRSQQQTTSPGMQIVTQMPDDINGLLKIDDLVLSAHEPTSDGPQFSMLPTLRPPVFAHEPEQDRFDMKAEPDAASKAFGKPQFLDIFDDIRTFQVGTLKPATSKDECPIFVPLYPFMYSSVEYGETLRGKVRMTLVKQSQERMQIQRE